MNGGTPETSRPNARELFDLKGRVALVTGGSRGLGLAIAEALGDLGASVAISARKENELQDAAAHLRGRGIRAEYFVNDLGKVDTIPAMVDGAIAALGHIDILVNNAGISWGAPAETHPLEAWHKVMNLNLTGPFRVTQEVATRSMIPRRYGRIINIASVAGLQGAMPDVLRAIAYHTSKGGLVNFTRALAGEWGQHGIAVNAICPGFILTRLTKDVLPKIEGRLKETTPLKQIGREQDVQGLALLLASEAGRHITGQAIAVDGGASVV